MAGCSTIILDMGVWGKESEEGKRTHLGGRAGGRWYIHKALEARKTEQKYVREFFHFFAESSSQGGWV